MCLSLSSTAFSLSSTISSRFLSDTSFALRASSLSSSEDCFCLTSGGDAVAPAATGSGLDDSFLSFRSSSMDGLKVGCRIKTKHSSYLPNNIWNPIFKWIHKMLAVYDTKQRAAGFLLTLNTAAQLQLLKQSVCRRSLNPVQWAWNALEIKLFFLNSWSGTALGVVFCYPSIGLGHKKQECTCGRVVKKTGHG